MSDDDENVVVETTSRQAHRVAIMVAGSILIAVVLVMIALHLYNKSDAAQLDLSGPRYKGVQGQISKEKLEDFAPVGPLDQKTIDDFRTKFDIQAEKATKVDGFGNGALDDTTIGLDNMQPNVEVE